MIKMNNDIIEIGSFPDGTIHMKQRPFDGPIFITWKYENDREFLALIYLVKHLHTFGMDDISLFMPYIPNARQDRIKSDADIFTLKYFAELINGLNFKRVIVFDPHSTVSGALIDRIVYLRVEEFIEHAINRIGVDVLMFYPDSGAAHRYGDMIKKPYAYGIKNRDWETGKIMSLDVVDNGNTIEGRDILIVDDICSRGGTFLHSAKKLKELGANDIYLYVSHCENTVLEGELLSSGLIKRIFTTDSIFTSEHELIEVFK